MKRLTVVLIVFVAAMLVVVAPASAATVLQGTFVSGVATQQKPALPHTPKTVDLVASGQVTITIGASSTSVGGRVLIDVAPGLDPMGPFPTMLSPQYFAWEPAVWDETSGSYTVVGRMERPPLTKSGLAFTATLVAWPDTGRLTIDIVTTGSYWNWQDWYLEGVLF